MIITKVLGNIAKAKHIAPLCYTFRNVTLYKLTMDQLDLKDKRILMRVDFNVPIKNGLIINTQRIVQSLESIKYALKKGAKSIILISHLGSPNGQKNSEYSLKPIADELKKLLKKDIIFVPDCMGAEVEGICKNPEHGSIILLENLRFYEEKEGTTKNAKEVFFRPDDNKIKTFRNNLAQLADIYINDDFGTVHRAHSSILDEGYEHKAAGFSLAKELKYFSQILQEPLRPFLLIIGGDKVTAKLPIIKNVLEKVDNIIICGGMAYTFLKLLDDMTIGNSVFSEKGSTIILDIMTKAFNENVEIYLPVDFICGTKISSDAEICNATVQSGIPRGYMGLDIGPESRRIFQKIIDNSKLILWNGPPGIFEIGQFSKGTEALIDAIASATEKGAISIMGGGSTAATVTKFKRTQIISHISSGGSSFLRLLEGKELPGIKALSDII